MSKPVISFRLDPELIKALEKEAKSENRSLSNYVELVLKSRKKTKASQ